jgi:insulysin
MPSTRVLTTLSCLLLVLGAGPALAQDDERTYRKLTLENGLRVVLASDPDLNVSSASMAVGIGANGDPEEMQGLAHFLEHMLFLGTEKYPELNGYGNFLQSRGGASNAYTAQDHTNYHFQVNHDALPEALDRFAQFFISPTLNYEYAEREMAAVNSEHQKNTMDDTWRLQQLQRSQFREDHPANAFSTGNATTLAEASEEGLRAFFNDYYQAENMTLAVVSTLSLDEQERMVREQFADVRSDPVRPWSAPADLLEEADGLRLLRVVPVQDMRQLRITFDVPSQRPHALQKIGTLVGMTMGDEGKGSLLSYLKGLGLATSLSAGINESRYYSQCSVSVGLTPAGLEQWSTVLELCFAYVRVLQTSGFPRHIWDELRVMSTLHERYSAKPEGTQAAIDLSNSALEYGLEVAERVAYTFEEPDPTNYQALVDSLTPANCMVFLVAPGLETDQTEEWYGTQYSSTELQGEAFSSLTEVEAPDGLHLPEPNPFVPDDVSLLPVQPVLLEQDAGVTLYYAQDTEFRRPKVALFLHVLSPVAYDSARSATLSALYAAVVQDQLNEVAYPALMAGLQSSLSSTRQGLVVTVAGYSDSAFRMLEVMSSAMRGGLDPAAFARVKERMSQGLRNFPLGQSYAVGSEFSRRISLQHYVTPAATLAALESLTLEDLQAHVDALFARTHVEALCAGNLTAAQAREHVALFRAALGSEPFPREEAHRDATLFLGEGDEVVLTHAGATDQASIRLEYQVGEADLSTRMAAELIARGVQNYFYTEMRTKQELGYIVFSGTYNRDNTQSLVYIIQSGTHDAEDLTQRAEACVATFPAEFAGMPDAQFEAIRESLIEDRRKEPKSIGEQAGMFFDAAFTKEGEFAWIEHEIEALQQLSREDVQALLERTVAEETRRRVMILINAAHHDPFASPGNVGDDWAAFQEGRTYSRDRPGY